MSTAAHAASRFEASSRTRQAQIEVLNWDFAQLEAEAAPAERIARAADLFAGRVVLASSFGPTAPILLKEVAEIAPEVPIVTIRHGHETPRTLELAAWAEQTLGLEVYIYEAPRLEAPPEDTPQFAEFQRRIKVEPFQRMLDDLRPLAYFSGRMRWQTVERSELPFVEDKGNVVAINPIADLSVEAAATRLGNFGLPPHEDYFDPAKGRRQNLECGLNTAAYGRNDRLGAAVAS